MDVPKRIHVTGAPGSGTSTLGKALAASLGYQILEADDFFWLQTDPPYTAKADSKQRLQNLLDAIGSRPVVIAGSVMNWGAVLENSFDLIIFRTLDAKVRLERLHRREMSRFGKVNSDFLEWAGQYDEGRLPGRSRQLHEVWLQEPSCQILRLEGDLTIVEQVEHTLEAIGAVSVRFQESQTSG